MGTPLIVGIHGLKNKPDRATLEAWWRESLAEGFRRNQGRDVPGEFVLAYWADLMHDAPLAPDADPEPYSPASGVGPLPRHSHTTVNVAKALGTEAAGSVVERLSALPGLNGLVIDTMAKRAPDLHRYYNDAERRGTVRARLIEALRVAHEANKRILLIAHSMGSIIAYDVLCAAAPFPGLSVAHLVTLGSPLGLHEVKAKARRECGPRLAVPECVERWDNFADRRDRIALDSMLGTDYAASDRGVRIRDRSLINGYVSSKTGVANPHKIYGYLRAPEITDLISDFVG